MLPSSRLADLDQRGSASLEFILVGVILLVPLAYLIMTLGQIQEQALGAQAAARHVVRSLAYADNPDAARDNAEKILSSVADEYGMEPEDLEFSISCTPAGSACPTAGAIVRVTISTSVTFPLVPPFFGLDKVAAVPVSASASGKVSRFWDGAG